MLSGHSSSSFLPSGLGSFLRVCVAPRLVLPGYALLTSRVVHITAPCLDRFFSLVKKNENIRGVPISLFKTTGVELAFESVHMMRAADPRHHIN